MRQSRYAKMFSRRIRSVSIDTDDSGMLDQTASAAVTPQLSAKVDCLAEFLGETRSGALRALIEEFPMFEDAEPSAVDSAAETAADDDVDSSAGDLGEFLGL